MLQLFDMHVVSVFSGGSQHFSLHAFQCACIKGVVKLLCNNLTYIPLLFESVCRNKGRD